MSCRWIDGIEWIEGDREKGVPDLHEEPRMTAGKTAKVASRARLARGEREK